MWRKLLQLRVLKRVYLERLGEPLIYNFISLFVLIFGNIVSKIEYDLVPRQPYAFGLNEAFKFANNEKNKLGINKIIICEFGVASGAGLINLCKISEKLSKHYAMPYEVIGFDSGEGMPNAIDYRDHPEKYHFGDFVPHNKEMLIQSLPENSKIYYGDIAEKLIQFTESLKDDEYLGFVSIDVDYYSSTIKCLELFKSEKIKVLPKLPIYFDDVNNLDHNEYCGELLAIKEFNEVNSLVRISKMNQIRNWRIFKNALYIDQMYWVFNFNDQYFTENYHKGSPRTKLSNPYLKFEEENHTGP